MSPNTTPTDPSASIQKLPARRRPAARRGRWPRARRGEQTVLGHETSGGAAAHWGGGGRSLYSVASAREGRSQSRRDAAKSARIRPPRAARPRSGARRPLAALDLESYARCRRQPRNARGRNGVGGPRTSATGVEPSSSPTTQSGRDAQSRAIGAQVGALLRAAGGEIAVARRARQHQCASPRARRAAERGNRR